MESAEAGEFEMWMQLQAEAMERCIVGDHRRDSHNNTTPPRTTYADF